MEDWRAALRAAMDARGITPRLLAKYLGLNNPEAARRRLRGASGFTPYEFARLSQVFGLPTDPRKDPPQALHLFTESSADDVFDGDRFLASILGLAQTLEAMAGDGAPTYYVSTTDLPFSYLCGYPRLAALRIFALEGGGGRRDVDFDYERMRAARPQLFADMATVAELHATTDNVEVWSANPLAPLLRTIETLHARDAISPRLAQEAFDDLDALVAGIREAAKTGVKPGGGTFSLHRHDLLTRVTDVVVVAPGFRLTLHTLRHPHFASSTAPATAELFLALFERLRAEATRIDGEAPYAYRDYAANLLADVEAVRRRMLPEEG